MLLSFRHAGAEGERSASTNHKNRCLLDDISDCDCCLGCSYQVRPCHYSYYICQDSSTFKVHYYVRLPLFYRLFQVIVRIDDCLALLNLVSKGAGDISVTF